MTVSLARRRRWKRDEVVPAWSTEHCQFRELHRLLGKKTLEAAIYTPQKKLWLPPSSPKDGSR